jgi:hypothetical protein
MQKGHILRVSKVSPTKQTSSAELAELEQHVWGTLIKASGEPVAFQRFSPEIPQAPRDPECGMSEIYQVAWNSRGSSRRRS